MPTELINGMGQTFFALALLLEFFTIAEAPQVLDQQASVDQEGPAGLVAAEAVQQLDRLPAPQSETDVRRWHGPLPARRKLPAVTRSPESAITTRGLAGIERPP